MRSALKLGYVVMITGLAISEEPGPSPPTSSAPTEQSAPSSHSSIELKSDASGTVSQEEMRDLLRRAAEKDLENDKRLRDYTYIQREEEHKLDSHGQVKKTESRTSEVLQIYGEQVERLIEKDDRPLS